MKGLRSTIRDLIVANMMDGDDGGRITMDASVLADEVSELIATFLLEGLEDYYGFDISESGVH